MGFLSRKSKFVSTSVEEPHPIVEELERMEAAVPETDKPAGPVAEQDQGDSPAGPVAAGDPPPPAVAKASSGAVPPATPPAGEMAVADAEEPTRLMARDLIAPSRHEAEAEEAEIGPEGPVKHAEVIAF